MRCNYKFDRDKAPSRCPYCGAENTIKRQLSAQDILNEVDTEEKIIESSKKERKF